MSRALSPSAAAMPAGPAPTTSTPGPPFGTLAARCSATWSPCMIAFLMRPIPPSSPTTWTPARDDSNTSLTSGRSTPRSALPNTRRMAPTGHSAAQSPWPMQWSAWTSRAAPSTTPRMSPSGQALRQERLPMQMFGSMTGWSERARCWPRRRFSSRAATSLRVRLQRRARCPAPSRATTSSDPETMRSEIGSMRLSEDEPGADAGRHAPNGCPHLQGQGLHFPRPLSASTPRQHSENGLTNDRRGECAGRGSGAKPAPYPLDRTSERPYWKRPL